MNAATATIVFRDMQATQYRHVQSDGADAAVQADVHDSGVKVVGSDGEMEYLMNNSSATGLMWQEDEHERTKDTKWALLANSREGSQQRRIPARKAHHCETAGHEPAGRTTRNDQNSAGPRKDLLVEQSVVARSVPAARSPQPLDLDFPQRKVSDQSAHVKPT